MIWITQKSLFGPAEDCALGESGQKANTREMRSVSADIVVAAAAIHNNGRVFLSHTLPWHINWILLRKFVYGKDVIIQFIELIKRMAVVSALRLGHDASIWLARSRTHTHTDCTKMIRLYDIFFVVFCSLLFAFRFGTSVWARQVPRK